MVKQVLWSSFDKLHTSESSFKNVLLLGYTNGFQVLDIDDASDVSEFVSRRDDPVTFLQMQPLPAKCEGVEGFRSSHPILLAVADEAKGSGPIVTGRDGSVRNGHEDPLALSPTVVRFYSLRSHNYVHVLRFRSTVYMVRCSPRIVAVGLGSQVSFMYYLFYMEWNFFCGSMMIYWDLISSDYGIYFCASLNVLLIERDLYSCFPF